MANRQTHWVIYNFTRWRRSFVTYFLGPDAKVKFVNKLDSRLLEDFGNIDAGRIKLLVWSSKLTDKIQAFSEQNNLDLYLMEDGFLRSVGLGSEGAKPLSLIIDKTGIYYDATRPSDLENLLNEANFDEELLARAKTICEQIVSLRLSKYNVGDSGQLFFPEGKKIILVPGQVETDASIAKGSPHIKTNEALLKAVRNDNPDAYIVYKPHPDVLVGRRIGHLEHQASQFYDQVITNFSIIYLFDHIDEVHTMSSLSGFEALLRGKKVVTYGLPFYAGWGLTEDKLICERRKRRLTLDELVAATLIIYPIYVDPVSGHVCDVETALHILKKQMENVEEISALLRFKRKIRSAFRFMAE